MPLHAGSLPDLVVGWVRGSLVVALEPAYGRDDGRQGCTLNGVIS